MKQLKIFILLYTLSLSKPSLAVLGDGGAGWAQMHYLLEILQENTKRFKQLQKMIEAGKARNEHLKWLHSGLENSAQLLESLPIKDKNILRKLKGFSETYKAVTEIYGKIPKGQGELMHRLHDQTVAESVTMVGGAHRYAKRQEENANLLGVQIRRASPKGAARMSGETNAKILHTLNQLLKINAQILKLQGERLAMENGKGKGNAGAIRKASKDMGEFSEILKKEINLGKF